MWMLKLETLACSKCEVDWTIKFIITLSSTNTLFRVTIKAKFIGCIILLCVHCKRIRKKTKGVFIIYGRGGGGEVNWRGGENFTTYCRGWGGPTIFLAYFFGWAIFFNALFWRLFFCESDITCIITVIIHVMSLSQKKTTAQQQQHNSNIMHVFKTWWGEQKFSNSVMGVGGIFSPHICEGEALFWPVDFAEPPLPPTPTPQQP